jgi:hypothetical protein
MSFGTLAYALMTLTIPHVLRALIKLVYKLATL